MEVLETDDLSCLCRRLNFLYPQTLPMLLQHHEQGPSFGQQHLRPEWWLSRAWFWSGLREEAKLKLGTGRWGEWPQVVSQKPARLMGQPGQDGCARSLAQTSPSLENQSELEATRDAFSACRHKPTVTAERWFRAHFGFHGLHSPTRGSRAPSAVFMENTASFWLGGGERRASKVCVFFHFGGVLFI